MDGQGRGIGALKGSQTFTALSRLARPLECLGGWIDRNPRPVLILFSILHVVTSIRMMRIKPFWMDELYTLYVAKAASVSELLSMIRDVVDHQPPPFFLLTRAFLKLPLTPEISARLPELMGYWLMCICVFAIVSRRTSGLFGVVATFSALPLLPYVYSFEARPYGLMAGLCALALYGWMLTGEGRRRAGLVTCFLGLAGAVSVCYYAVLFLAPLALGQAVKSALEKRLDLSMWICLALGSGVSLLYLPLVLASLGRLKESSWFQVSATSFIDVYAHSVGRMGLAYLVCAGVLLAAYLLIRRQRPANPVRRPSWHEATAAAAVLLSPFLGQVAALQTRALHGRYVIQTVIGIVLVFAWVCWWLSRGDHRVGAALIGLALLFFAANVRLRSELIQHEGHPGNMLLAWLAAAPADLPVSVDDPLVWFPLAHYQPEPVRRRLYYAIDEGAARRRTPAFTGRGLRRMAAYYPILVAWRGEFQERFPRYLLFETGSIFAYQRSELEAEGASVTVLCEDGGFRLSLVEAAGPSR